MLLSILPMEGLVVLAALFGLYMAWSIGANDVANAMGTSVGSGALTLKQAVILAAVLEFTGAVVAGGSVAQTVRGGIVDPETTFVRPVADAGNTTADPIIASSGTAPDALATLQAADTAFQFAPELYIYAMLGALLGTAIWLTLASWRGMPVSTTHSIIGGVMGAGLMAAGTTFGWHRAVEGVNWGTVFMIFQSWVFAPLLGGLVAFTLFWTIKLTVFNRKDPLQAAERARPFFIFLDVVIIALALFLKGFERAEWYRALGWGLTQQILAAAAIAGIATLLVEGAIRWRKGRLGPHPTAEKLGPDTDVYRQVERRFIGLQIVTAGSVAFAHGANDVANAIGPLAGIVATAQTGEFAAAAPIPFWTLVLGGIGIVLGLATWGWRVMLTIGKKISEITPSRGFSAELAAAGTIILATVYGIPVSTSQVLVGAVIGVGLARGVAAIDLRVLRSIVASWLLTLPAAALLSGLLYLLFKSIL